jgi:hypothetical protein
VLWLVTTALLAVPDGTAVIVSGRSELSQDEGQAIARQVEQALSDKGLRMALPVHQAQATLAGLSECLDQRPCTASRAVLLGVPAVVSLQAAKAARLVSLHLELISAADGALLTQDDVVVPTPVDAARLAASLDAFAEHARAALAALTFPVAPKPPPAAEALPPPPPPPPSPRAAPPAVTEVTAAPDTPVATGTVPEPSAGRGLWNWAPATAGLVLAGAGIYFFAQAQSVADQFNRAAPGSLPDPAGLERQGINDRTAGIVFAAAGAAGLGATALLLGLDAGRAAQAVSLAPSPGGFALGVHGTWP